MLVVNHLIRLPVPGVTFAPLPSRRKTPRVAAAQAAQAAGPKLDNPLRLLYDKEYYQYESSMQAV